MQIETHKADTIVIAANPKAGVGTRANLVESLRNELRQRGYIVERFDSLTEASDRSRLAMAEHRLCAVVAAGGDGTVASLVNILPERVPIAILPLGTENLLAKYVHQSISAKSVADTIQFGHTVHLDAGRANNRIFLLMLSCGFDAEVVRKMHSKRMGNITHFSYLKPILETIRTYKYPVLQIDYDSPGNSVTHHRSVARWAFVVNLPRYAGGLQFVPGAIGTDGLLDLCTFHRGNWWTLHIVGKLPKKVHCCTTYFSTF